MIKVLLADDHQMFIDGMKAVLVADPKIKIVGEALNGEKVLEILGQTEADVVVLDIRMPILDGTATTKEIREKYPKVKVLILTMYNEKKLILNLMNIGASGYILKNKSSEELLMAIHNVHSGRSHFGLEILDKITSTEIVKEEIHLTKREEQILILIAEAQTTKQIANRLNIAEPTVNTHRRNLLQKLEFPNDKYLVRYAIKIGLVKP